MTEELNMTNRTDDRATQGAGDKYRRAFLLTLVALILVIGGASWMWWRSPFNPMHRVQQAATTGTDLSRTPAQIAATIFHGLGVPLDLELKDAQGRPIPVVDGGNEPIKELFA